MSYVDVKARAIVALGLVEVTRRDLDGSLTAIVQGTTGNYQVIRRASGVWSCSCEAWFWRLECSHQIAVEAVVERLPRPPVVQHSGRPGPSIGTGEDNARDA